MFQVESRAQMSCLPRLHAANVLRHRGAGRHHSARPDRRPDGESLSAAAAGQGRVTYPHPSLEPVLERTLGVPLFQEQLLRMAMIVAEFHRRRSRRTAPRHGLQALGGAHARIEVKLRAGMTRNGIAREAQEQIILSITSFALYGFPESHAASFALDRLCQRLSEVPLSRPPSRRPC